MSNDPIVIVSGKRTAIGAFQGALAGAKSQELGATAIKAAIEAAGISGDDVNEVFMGCVLPAGLGQAPARQAALGAGLPTSVGCVTVNKVCGSGMKTVMMGADLISAGSADVIVAGGMESMTNAPYLLPNARGGMRMGHGSVIDHMFFDGLQNPYDNQMMGTFGDQCATRYNFTREQQDEFSIESVKRAQAAVAEGRFAEEIVPVTVKHRKGESAVEQDEEPGRCNIEKIPTLRAAFSKEGTVTAASSSSISDGAAALVLMRESEANKRGLKPLAKIVGHSAHAQEPEWFTTAPVGAITNVLKRVGWKAEDVDLYEINEAFAVVAMAAMKEHNLPHEKVNVNGGACALGHPIGATGARLIVTLIHALKARQLKKGVASLCIGGGEATAIAIEML